MKKIVLGLLVATVFVACRKTSPMEESENTLEVTEANMAVIGKRTATWCGPCGSWGFPQFESLKQTYKGKALFMAWKDAFVSDEGSELFREVGPEFNLGSSVPTFFYNFIADAHDSVITQHIESDYVVASANYDMEVSGQNVSLKTTTKFFANVEGVYYIAPYMMVDNIVGYQNGHDDGNNTIHHNYVARIAKPTTVSSVKNFGYQLTTNGAERGYTVNLDFTAKKDVTWNTKDISFGLVIYKEEPWGLQFVNAFTK